jgi:hypothetical protein
MPVAATREAVSAFQAAGGAIKYTEYADAGHEVWTRAFAEPDLPAWLFAQKRSASDCNHSLRTCQ